MKLVLLGDPGCGKTAIVRRHLVKKFVYSYMPTDKSALYRKSIVVCGRKYWMDIEDTTGQASFSDYDKTDEKIAAFIACFAINDRAGFLKLATKCADHARRDIPIYIVGTKLDLRPTTEQPLMFSDSSNENRLCASDEATMATLWVRGESATTNCYVTNAQASSDCDKALTPRSAEPCVSGDTRKDKAGKKSASGCLWIESGTEHTKRDATSPKWCAVEEVSDKISESVGTSKEETTSDAEKARASTAANTAPVSTEPDKAPVSTEPDKAPTSYIETYTHGAPPPLVESECLQLVTRAEGLKLAGDNMPGLGYFECSSKTGVGVESLFKAVCAGHVLRSIACGADCCGECY